MKMALNAGAALLLATLAVPLSSVQAQDAVKYPQKVVRMIVPYAPGGGTDVLGRLAAKGLTEAFGQPFIVENKPGANAIIGTDMVARSPADGHMLLVAPSGPLVMNPVLRKSLPYDPQKDFVPVSILGRLPLMVTVKASLPVKSLKELIEYAKAKPNDVSYANSAPLFQLATELFKQRTGTNFLSIPYRSSGEMATALLSGEVTLAISDVPPIAGMIKSGDLRALAYTDERRSSAFPDVPTVAEAGLPGTEVATLVGIVAPAGTPEPIVRRLQNELIRIVRTAESRERFATLGVEPVGSTSEEFARAIKADTERWADVAKRANIEPE